jgi:hypothetical protein
MVKSGLRRAFQNRFFGGGELLFQRKVFDLLGSTVKLTAPVIGLWRDTSGNLRYNQAATLDPSTHDAFAAYKTAKSAVVE